MTEDKKQQRGSSRIPAVAPLVGRPPLGTLMPLRSGGRQWVPPSEPERLPVRKTYLQGGANPEADRSFSNLEFTMANLFVGVDVSKQTLDLFVSGHDCVHQFDNSDRLDPRKGDDERTSPGIVGA